MVKIDTIMVKRIVKGGTIPKIRDTTVKVEI